MFQSQMICWKIDGRWIGIESGSKVPDRLNRHNAKVRKNVKLVCAYILRPAAARVYKNSDEAMKDFNANKAFYYRGKIVRKNDLPRKGVIVVESKGNAFYFNAS